MRTKIFDGFTRPVYGKGETPRSCVVFKTNRSNEIDFGAGNLYPFGLGRKYAVIREYFLIFRCHSRSALRYLNLNPNEDCSRKKRMLRFISHYIRISV